VGGGGSVRHYRRWGSERISFDLKVPRHCPLVLLVRVRLEFRVNKTFIYVYYCNVIGVGAAALDRNLDRH
jgi:hypothetical protein